MKIKAQRISAQVQREISNIILHETRNEIIKSLTITGCEVTNDLSFAKIYYTFLGDYTQEAIKVELERSTPYLRKTLANTINIRHTPELIFIFDDSIAYGTKIEKLIAKIHEDK